ncbi:MAG TPA: DUF4395 family protein [Candidatus Limnocylindria bacterium]|nr:DUF4395 family protein [Candidatus Limnocylindria bacterium]
MIAAHSFHRTADPYRDLDVIDARAPRVNQAVIGLGSVLAAFTGWWPLLAILAAQLGIVLAAGRRFCLPCVAYFELIQPRIGEGPIEDARPPRCANGLGFAGLTAASAAYVLGWPAMGLALSGLVAILALLASATGFCAGCQLYRVEARIRRIRGRPLNRLELADLGADSALQLAEQPVTVLFSHPLCTACRQAEAALAASGRSYHIVDVRARPDLARKYGIALVPALVEVSPGGAVRHGLRDDEMAPSRVA